ncbi:hypothetical protein [Hymenobacter cheonanensis]|uniref:hypothetical protein n=1 Tax=Hymenobacter sp. CA2-7 TaxID=3063993 RepID=UPI002712393E|nr:hypothetical protein [Hymenobacter sp. CA2-7]MDO7888238.1 hypothetical protein [Hymenobacter sp. CA2-7]
MSCWQLIEQERGSYPVELLCWTLDVLAARYYAWRKRQQSSPVQPASVDWEEALKNTFGQHKRCYGTRRLRALVPRVYTPRTTDSTHGLRCAPNRLLDQPKPTQPNQVWVSDITCLPLALGQWAYLCASRMPAPGR